ncbi:MAG: TolC family protein [Candidatus Cryptobacteroides sp.]
MNHRIFTVAILSLACTGAFGQRLSLKECMEYALDKSAKLKVQEADVDDARIARRDAILKAFTPAVEAGTYAYSNFGRSVDPETNTYVSTTSFNNGYSISGGIVLFNGFEAVNNMKISKTSLMMGIEQEQKLKDEICLATMEAFYNVVYYSKLSEIVGGQVKTLEDALSLVRRQEELGQKGYADVVQTEADLADMEYNLIVAQNNLASALITLKDIMFWEEDNELVIDMEGIEQASTLVDGDSVAECSAVADYAIGHNPSVLIAKGKMDNARLSLRTAKWKFSPYLSLNAGWSTSYYTYPGLAGYVPVPYGQQFRNNGGEYIQLSLSFPIYNRLQTFSNLRKKKNDYRRAEAEYDSAVRQVQAEVERAVQDRNGAGAALNQAERRESVQEEAWRLNVKKFEQGLISGIDFRKASDNLLNAKAERLNALLKFRLKSSVVKYYDGISYIDQY